MHEAVHLLSVWGACACPGGFINVPYHLHTRICGIPALRAGDVPFFLFKITEVRW